LFHAQDQRGYHESIPFTKWEHLRAEAMRAIAQSGGMIKYGHSEVGNFTVGDQLFEQNEIEFIPSRLDEAADQLLIAKWILRTLAYKYGVSISFAPKITTGKAGSGMHVHTKLVKDGQKVMLKEGKLSDTAKKLIAGFMKLSPSLTAFGNINPTSYFRLVPHQEAPTNICWGDRNRSTLVRVPLGWTGKNDMSRLVNPKEPDYELDISERQTVEYRAADGSADIYLLMAGLAVAARHGLTAPDSLEYAEKTYVDVNIFHDENKHRTSELSQLPTSCWESAEALENQKTAYLEHGVFSEGMLNWIETYLKSFNDKNLRAEIGGDEAKILQLVEKYFNCG
jgi:glutamine synthetase